MQVSCTACPSPQGRTVALLCPDSKGDSQPQTINQEGKGNGLLSGVRAGRMVWDCQTAFTKWPGPGIVAWL